MAGELILQPVRKPVLLQIVQKPVLLQVAGGRGSTGIQGLPAAQDIMFVIANGIQGGDIYDSGPLERAATYTKAKFWSRSGVLSPRIIGLYQNNNLITQIVVVPASLPTKQLFVLATNIVGLENDVLSLGMPAIADIQLTDFTLTLGSST